MSKEPQIVKIGDKTYQIPFDGYRVGIPHETVVSSLGHALEEVDDALYRDPDDIVLQSIKWWIEEAFNKAVAGEPVNPYELDLKLIEDHNYR